MPQAERKPTLPRQSWRAAPLGECKGGETWLADGRSCSCLFHNAGFLSRKYYSRNSQSLSDLSVSCRKCVEMGSEHPGLLTRRFPSLLHSPPRTWLWVQRWAGRCLVPPYLATRSAGPFGVCALGLVAVRFTGARGRLRNQCRLQTSLSLCWEAQRARASAGWLTSCPPCKLLTSTESHSPLPPPVFAHTDIHMCARMLIYTHIHKENQCALNV